jgi:hypothetical protein
MKCLGSRQKARAIAGYCEFNPRTFLSSIRSSNENMVLFVICACALKSLSAMTGDISLGVSAKSDDGYIYLPIRISSSFFIEPYIGYYKAERSDIARELGNSTEDKHPRQYYGIGLFGSHEIKDKFSAYYGFRTAYAKSSRDIKYYVTYG